MDPGAHNPSAGAGATGVRPRRTLVTGGSGFIGSHLTELLLARGDHVTVVDDLSTGVRDNLPAAHERLRFIEADLSDALAAFGKGETFDVIFHLAAAVGVALVMDDPVRAIETNVEQTADLLRFAVARSASHGRPIPTLIASSSEVYGKSSRTPFSEEDDVHYGPTTAFRWSYACSKAVDEYLALAYHRREDLPAVVARLFNTVGPRQVGRYGMVLPRFVEAALAGRDLVVFGEGTQTRCFCDVRDVVRALATLVETPECAGRVFNVGSDRSISIAELADLVIRETGSSSSRRLLSYDEAYPAGFEDLKHRRPDLTRLRDAIGFSPAIELEQTIRDLADWLREKPRVA